MAVQMAELTLTLSVGERAELLKLLERAAEDIHAEKRRTEAAAYHDELAQQENVIRALVAKVRKLGA